MLSNTQVHITSSMYYMKDKATHGVQLQKKYTEKILGFMQCVSQLINFPINKLSSLSLGAIFLVSEASCPCACNLAGSSGSFSSL